jgi:hypothetical protein
MAPFLSWFPYNEPSCTMPNRHHNWLENEPPRHGANNGQEQGDRSNAIPVGWAVQCGANQWIGLRENLQETMVFTIKYRGFL